MFGDSFREFWQPGVVYDTRKISFVLAVLAVFYGVVFLLAVPRARFRPDT